jgi:hypothetical protein
MEMKFVINSTCVFLAALVLAACAGGAGVQTRRISDQDVARLMAVHDNLIVPGERVGPVFFGMTEAQLYQKMGNPDQSGPMDNGATIFYVWRDISVDVHTSTHTVFLIGVSGPSYATAEGVSTGTSELALKSKLGPPAGERLAYTDKATLKLCYNSGSNSGLTAFVDEGKVTRFVLFPPGLCA